MNDLKEIESQAKNHFITCTHRANYVVSPGETWDISLYLKKKKVIYSNCGFVLTRFTVSWKNNLWNSVESS